MTLTSIIAPATEELAECERCKGTGVTVHRVGRGTYLGAGPAPDDARRVFELDCDECRGTGSIWQTTEAE